MDRKLTAILSADVQGYSRLMGDDEAATVRTVTAYRELMSVAIRTHHGRVVDATGDNLLADFASVVDAVQGAVEIQQVLAQRNAELPDHRKMRFRIGINLGDVIVEGERIYGDGVNIAARVQSLSAGGGICLSGTAYDQVKNKLALGYESLGTHVVKNIAEPVRAYRVRLEPGTPPPRPRARDGSRARRVLAVSAAAIVLGAAGAAAVWYGFRGLFSPAWPVVTRAAPSLRLPDKPSIAVLPFANMSGDPEQEYFSDGITEDVITDLSKLSGLFVIARNSTFTYKGHAIKVQQVGEELGVGYVLEGSVRRAGDRLRITAQLVDARTGHHLWAERYDRHLRDVFALQDEITREIVAALAVKLTGVDEARLGQAPVRGGRPPGARAPTASLDAYDAVMRGMAYERRFTREANLRARQLYERAIQLDPEYARAYAGVGWTYHHEWTMQWSLDPRALERASEFAEHAKALDDDLAACRMLLAHVYLWEKQHARAIEEAWRAISLDPNNADHRMDLGQILTWAGQPDEAVRLIEEAMRLNPRYPPTYLYALGHAHWVARRYEKAIAALREALMRNPDFLPAHGFLVVAYSELGRLEEARAEQAEVLRLSPAVSSALIQERLPYADEAVLKRFVEAIRRSGLK